jgi:micrococcal nuclease
MLKPRLFRLLNISSVLIIIATFLGWKLLGDRNNWTAVSGEAPPPAEAWIVTRVVDGDTITVRQTTGEEMKVRLGCIDAPEKAQPFGQESKANLQKLIDQAQGEVQVSVIEKDRYGRSVAEVFTILGDGKERSLNEEQLSSGMAYFYKKYSNCPNREVFQRAEQIAIANRAGVWSQSGLETPWNYRRRIRQN